MKFALLLSIVVCSIVYGRIDCEYMNDVQERAIRSICTKYNCSCCGTGGAAFYDIDRIFLMFQFYDTYSDAEVRKMMLDISNIFIITINEDKKIRPYLREFPASVSSIRIGTFFPSQEGQICIAGMNYGEFYTCKYFLEEAHAVDDIHETYEEMVQKINEDMANVEIRNKIF